MALFVLSNGYTFNVKKKKKKKKKLERSVLIWFDALKCCVELRLEDIFNDVETQPVQTHQRVSP